ncbi:hypothetical protein BH10PSE9_BH10PSE9_16150 [soil metagenome]
MRSLLLVHPEDHAALGRPLEAAPDVLVLGVAGGAPALVAGSFASLAAKRTVPLYVRVSSTHSESLPAELDALVPLRPDGIVLSGAAGGHAVTRLAALLRPREALAGIADGATPIVAISAGTAAAVLGLDTFAGASARLAGLVCDAAALAAASGTGTTAGPIMAARALTVLAASAAAVPAIDGAYGGNDLAGLEAEAEAARRDGFAGKIATRPEQVAVINRVFSRPASST